jgi:hypothetical protein
LGGEQQGTKLTSMENLKLPLAAILNKNYKFYFGFGIFRASRNLSIWNIFPHSNIFIVLYMFGSCPIAIIIILLKS